MTDSITRYTGGQYRDDMLQGDRLNTHKSICTGTVFKTNHETVPAHHDWGLNWGFHSLPHERVGKQDSKTVILGQRYGPTQYALRYLQHVTPKPT